VRTHPSSEVVAAVVNEYLAPTECFQLIDVGASGGIAPYWSAFGQRLRAVGFDPIAVETAGRAPATTGNPHVTYETAFVGSRNFERLFPVSERQIRVDPYTRTSAARAQVISATRRGEHSFEAARLADRRIVLDEYFGEHEELDFLKIDTDGSDLEVLLGAERILRSGQVLGLLVETQFQGWAHEYSNTFANIDRHLQARGFALYELDNKRYTRAALPGLFKHSKAAQTHSGQLLWADALYFRDLAHSHYEQLYGYQITRERLLKLVALFDLFELADCAAELLIARPDLTTAEERARLLNLLVKSAGFEGAYETHLERFENDPSAFLLRHQPASIVDPIAPSTDQGLSARRQIEDLMQQLETCQRKYRVCRERLDTYKTKLEVYKDKLARSTVHAKRTAS
jgi:FkbM family methyltransferase